MGANARGLRKALVKALMRPLAFCLGFAVIFGIGTTLLVPNLIRDESHAAAPPNKLVEIYEAHDCWSGQAPVDVKVPGHVIVTRAGSDEPEYAGSVMVGRALEHVFDSRHPDLTVHAFCR